MLRKKIDSIEFGVLDPNTIRSMSVLEIKTYETYDKDGFPLENGLMDPHLGVINPGLKCKTCGQKMKSCPGHFGSLELVRPVIHPGFGKKVEQLLNITCESCGRIILEEDKLEYYRKRMEKGEHYEDIAKKINTKVKNVKVCPHCNAKLGKIMYDKPTNFFLDKERIWPTDIRTWLEKIPDSDLALLGYSQGLRPEWFVLTVLPIPPVTIRPSITLDSGIKSEDDLTHKLVDIVRTNEKLKENIESGAPQLIIEDLWDLLQYHITTYFDNNVSGVAPAKHRSGRPLRTLVQRLQGKKGRFRYNLTGKRVNFSARSTIIPDSYISINEVGVPKEIANTLTIPIRVNSWNLKEIKKMIKDTDKVVYVIRPDKLRKKVDENNKEAIAEEISEEYIIERKLQDGDIVLFNRQPSLHRISMMAHKVRVMEGKALRLNPIVCAPYNADFDGDEMNLHVPQTPEGITEAKELMLVQDQIISPRYGAPVIVPKEDGIAGLFVLTHEATEFTKEEAMQILYDIGITELPKPDRGKNYSGKAIFSMLLPKDLNLEYETTMYGRLKNAVPESKMPKDVKVKIKNGKLVHGIIDAKSLGEGKGVLIDALARKYGGKAVEDFYLKILRLSNVILTLRGLTATLSEYIASSRIMKIREKEIEKMLQESKEIIKKYKTGKLEPISGRNIDESFEVYLMRISSKAKASLEKELINEKMLPIAQGDLEMNTLVMILSGSRGSSTNLVNIAGMWGQANVREGRPTRGYIGRVTSLQKRDDLGLFAHGFIKHNFIEGMDAKEYFFHSMGGRQGEVDTGVSTKVSGYLYRRLSNSLKDLYVADDGTVRDATGRIIQTTYGEDSVFPMNSQKGKGINLEELI